MKKQLKGHKKELIKGKKYELIVNVGKNPETGIYDRRYRTFYGNAGQADAALRDFIFQLENPDLVASYQLLSDYLNEWYKSYYIPNHEQTSYKKGREDNKE